MVCLKSSLFITAVNPKGRHFKHVNRIVARFDTKTKKMADAKEDKKQPVEDTCVLDVHAAFPVESDTVLQMVLADSVISKEPSLAEILQIGSDSNRSDGNDAIDLDAGEYQLILHGRCLKVVHPNKTEPKHQVLFSFGGLVMALQTQNKVLDIKDGRPMFLLLKKISKSRDPHHLEESTSPSSMDTDPEEKDSKPASSRSSSRKKKSGR